MHLYGRGIVEHCRNNSQAAECADQRPKGSHDIPDILLLFFSIPQKP
jgi:hypothetical protein